MSIQSSELQQPPFQTQAEIWKRSFYYRQPLCYDMYNNENVFIGLPVNTISQKQWHLKRGVHNEDMHARVISFKNKLIHFH